jgi:hypothetical protein
LDCLNGLILIIPKQHKTILKNVSSSGSKFLIETHILANQQMKGIIPQCKPWTQNRFGGSIPPQGAGYGSLRPRLNGETVQLGSLLRKLLKQPLVVHSHQKGNQLVGSASLVRLRINFLKQHSSLTIIFLLAGIISLFFGVSLSSYLDNVLKYPAVIRLYKLAGRCT